MAIFFTILKIIGIVLLSILGLLLTLLLLLLLWPFQYRIAGQKKEKLNGYVAISWLFHIISVKAFYKDDFNIILRIFGIPIYNHKKKQNKKMDEAKENTREDTLNFVNEDDWDNSARNNLNHPNEVTLNNPNEDTLNNPDDENFDNSGKDNFDNTNVNIDVSDNINKDDFDNINDNFFDRENAKSDEQKYNDDAKKASFKSKIHAVFRKIKKIFARVIRFLENLPEKLESLSDTITEKIEKALDTYDYYDRLFMQKGTEYAIDYLKTKIIKLLKHLKPFYCKIIVDYTSEDPATIGKLMEYYAMAIPFLPKKIAFHPEFRDGSEEKDNLPALQFDAKIKGRFIVGYFVIIALQVLLNKRVKLFYKRLKREGV